jgi:hypothetical protein
MMRGVHERGDLAVRRQGPSVESFLPFFTCSFFSCVLAVAVPAARFVNPDGWLASVFEGLAGSSDDYLRSMMNLALSIKYLAVPRMAVVWLPPKQPFTWFYDQGCFLH